MRLLAACLFAGTVVAMTSVAVTAQDKGAKVLDHKMKAIDGKEVNLAEKYSGKVLLVVNVASQCGATPQYKQLEGLQDKYHDQGLAVISSEDRSQGPKKKSSNSVRRNTMSRSTCSRKLMSTVLKPHRCTSSSLRMDRSSGILKNS